jgi:hypothetical protein
LDVLRLLPVESAIESATIVQPPGTPHAELLARVDEAKIADAQNVNAARHRAENT